VSPYKRKRLQNANMDPLFHEAIKLTGSYTQFKKRAPVSRSGDTGGDRTLAAAAATSCSFCLAIIEGSRHPTRAATKEGDGGVPPPLTLVGAELARGLHRVELASLRFLGLSLLRWASAGCGGFKRGATTGHRFGSQ
jgi:hypothetical protein